MDQQPPTAVDTNLVPEVLRDEYRIVAESWRFLTGLRFALLTFAATILGVLLGGYQYVLKNLNDLRGLGE